MTTDVATRPVEVPGALALRGDQSDWTPAQRAALDQIGIADAPSGDQQVFLHVAQRSGLDPFARQIYMISRWDPQSGRNKWTIQTGIEGYRVIAERRKEYAGQLEPQWCGEDGVWREVWVSDKPPVAARVGVIRRDWPNPAWGVVHFWEFAATKKDGSLTHMWATKGRHQIQKCAESAALRKAFPQDFTGIYVDEEMEHLNNPPPRPIIDAESDKPAEPDWDALIKIHEAANDVDALKNVWNLAKGIRPNDNDLFERIAQAAERVKTALTSTDTPIDAPVQDAPDENFDRAKETRHIWALLQEAGMDTSDAGRNRRLHIMTRMLNRPTPLESFNDLTDSEIASAVGFMERRRADGDLSETLAQMAPTNLPVADIPTEAGASSSKGKAKMSAQEIDMARNEIAGATDITALGEIWNRHTEAYVIPPALKKVFEKRGEELKRQAADALWQQVLERAPEDWTTDQIDAHFIEVTKVAPDKATAADMQRYLDTVADKAKTS